VCFVHPQTTKGPGKIVGLRRVNIALAIALYVAASGTITPSTNPSPSWGNTTPIAAAEGGNNPSGPGRT
jgi:hypothetical protein